MKFIRFILWVAVTIVIAYFLTDLKIGGKTIKQKIDQLIHKAAPGLSRKMEAVFGSGETDSGLSGIPESKEGPKEEITADDEKKLDKLIEQNQ